MPAVFCQHDKTGGTASGHCGCVRHGETLVRDNVLCEAEGAELAIHPAGGHWCADGWMVHFVCYLIHLNLDDDSLMPVWTAVCVGLLEDAESGLSQLKGYVLSTHEPEVVVDCAGWSLLTEEQWAQE